jgi:hypothetical protein
MWEISSSKEGGNDGSSDCTFTFDEESGGNALRDAE